MIYVYYIGCQSSNIPDIYRDLCVLHCFRYLKIVWEHQIFQKIYNQVIQNYPRPDLLITDTFTVKSMDGSEGLGKNPTDRKRAGLIVSIVYDTRRVLSQVSFLSFLSFARGSLPGSSLLEAHCSRLTAKKLTESKKKLLWWIMSRSHFSCLYKRTFES